MVVNSVVISRGREIFSVDFDGSVDFSNKEKGRVEANCTSQQPECYHHHERVSKVEEGGHEFVNV